MTSQSDILKLSDHDRGQYGIAHAKHVVFEAVSSLWRRRHAQGMKQLDIAEFVEQSPSTVSRNLSGPGNWTLKTLGLYVEALNGELEVIVHAMEDPVKTPTNYDAYAELDGPAPVPMGVSNSAQTIGESTVSSFNPDDSLGV